MSSENSLIGIPAFFPMISVGFSSYCMDLYYILALQDLADESSLPPDRSERLLEKTDLNPCQLELEFCKAEFCCFCLWHLLIRPTHTAV